MKNALLIEGNELAGLVANHLSKNGYSTSGFRVMLTATALVVLGASKMDDEDHEDHEDEDHEDEDDDEDNSGELSVLAVSVFNEITERPCTANTIAERLGTSLTSVQRALIHLDERVAKVCATQENGKTVPMFMGAGTSAFEAFVEGEQARVASRVAECKDLVLRNVPKFYEARMERPEIVEKICENLSGEDLVQSFRCDSRAIFYALAEQNVLEHRDNGWRAFRTETDVKNVEMLRRNVEEILPNHEAMTLESIANSLPGEVDIGFLAHALGR